jgi:hypothetical protein
MRKRRRIILDFLSIGLGSRKDVTEVFLPREWLKTHSAGVEEALALAAKSRYDDKRDVYTFSDTKLGSIVYRTLFRKKSNEDKSKRRQRLLKTGGKWSESDFAKLWKIQNGKCYYTGVSLRACASVDHVIPISSRGCNTARNLALCTKRVNKQKKAYSKAEFIRLYGISVAQQKEMRRIDRLRIKMFPALISQGYEQG